MPTYTEFYCDPINGSNVNAGSDSGTPSMSDTAGTGSWNSSTNVYTTTATTGTVTVGQFLSIYSGSATVPAYIARITTVTGGSGSAWVITLSATAFAGVLPTTGSAFKAQCGGAWLGPTGSVGHPFTFTALNTANDAAGDPVRVSFKNSATYSITAAITVSGSVVTFQGMTATPGDLGRATLDGGTTGASFVLLALAGGNVLRDFVLQNNGATGTSAGLTVGTGSLAERVTVCNVRGAGFSVGVASVNECEAFGCNQSNTGSAGGFTVAGGAVASLTGCISHHNTGTSNCGFFFAGGRFDDCIADSNGLHGFSSSAITATSVYNCCAASNNGGDGIRNVSASINVRNSIFAANAGYDINQGTALASGIARVTNCAFHSTGSGATSGINDVSGSITLTGDPFVADATGNFALNNTSGAGAACRAAGRGVFIQTATRTGKVTGATNVSSIVITTGQPHGLVTGNLVTITGILGNTAANVTNSAITNLTATTFSVAVAGNGAYTSGGVWTTTQYSATTTSYPDVGAAQVSDTGGGGGGGGHILRSSIIQGLGVI